MTPKGASKRPRFGILRSLYKESNGYASNVGGAWACPECGCLDLEVSAWRVVNTGEVTEEEGPVDDLWCPTCETHNSESSACMVRIEGKGIKCTEHENCQTPERIHRYHFETRRNAQTGGS